MKRVLVYSALLFLAASQCFAMQQSMVSRMTLPKPAAGQESSLMDTLLSPHVLIPVAAAAVGYSYLSDKDRRDRAQAFVEQNPGKLALGALGLGLLGWWYYSGSDQSTENGQPRVAANRPVNPGQGQAVPDEFFQFCEVVKALRAAPGNQHPDWFIEFCGLTKVVYAQEQIRNPAIMDEITKLCRFIHTKNDPHSLFIEPQCEAFMRNLTPVQKFIVFGVCENFIVETLKKARQVIATALTPQQQQDQELKTAVDRVGDLSLLVHDDRIKQKFTGEQQARIKRHADFIASCREIQQSFFVENNLGPIAEQIYSLVTQEAQQDQPRQAGTV